MPASCYTKALREPIHFLWERRLGSKLRVAAYCSKAAVGLRFGKGEIIYDHAVPFRYLQEELLALEPVTQEAVLQVLEKFGTVVLVTKAESAELDEKGYSSNMPEGWDRVDPLARYRVLGIELVANPGRGGSGA
jgi:hypothetical protein